MPDDDKRPRKSHFFTISPPAGPLTKLPANYPPPFVGPLERAIREQMEVNKALLEQKERERQEQQVALAKDPAGKPAIDDKSTPWAKLTREGQRARFENFVSFYPGLDTSEVTNLVEADKRAEAAFGPMPRPERQQARKKAKWSGPIGRPRNNSI